MTIMSRILRLWKADIHGVMDNLEDKELLLKQYLREMENNLQQKATRLKQITDTQRKVDNNLEARHREIEKLEKDLTLALQKKKDDIAKLLIRRQHAQQNHCEHMQQQYESLNEEQKELSEILKNQNIQYETLKLKAAAFNRRAEQTRFNEANTVFSDTSSINIIDEDEIELELMRRKERLHEEGGAT